MKQKFLALLTLVASIVLTSSCIFIGPSVKGNGKVVEENRKAGKFNEIKVSRGMNVYITQGDETKVIVKADENLLEYIETNVENRVLKVTTKENIRKATSKKVFVTVKELENIRSLAGSNVYSENILRCDNLTISSTAGSNVKVEIDAKDVIASASAGSNIKIEGKSKSFEGKASAGSNIKAEGLTTKECNVKTSSGANIWIRVTGELQASANSGGNIFYYGNPKNLDTNSSSGGNIIKK